MATIPSVDNAASLEILLRFSCMNEDITPSAALANDKFVASPELVADSRSPTAGNAWIASLLSNCLTLCW